MGQTWRCYTGSTLQCLQLVTLRDLLGHETWDMIEVYMRLAEEDRRELYTKFSPVDALDMHHSVKGQRERAREWRNTRKKRD